MLTDLRRVEAAAGTLSRSTPCTVLAFADVLCAAYELWLPLRSSSRRHALNGFDDAKVLAIALRSMMGRGSDYVGCMEQTAKNRRPLVDMTLCIG